MQKPPVAHKTIEMYPPYVYNSLGFGTQNPARVSDIPSFTPVQTDTTLRTGALGQGQSGRGLPFIAQPYLTPRLNGYISTLRACMACYGENFTSHRVQLRPGKAVRFAADQLLGPPSFLVSGYRVPFVLYEEAGE
jgi:hypothetical protein